MKTRSRPWTWSLQLPWDHLGIPREEEEVGAEKDIFFDLLHASCNFVSQRGSSNPATAWTADRDPWLQWWNHAHVLPKRISFSRNDSSLNSGMPIQPVCFSDISLSLAMTYWKERSSEGKVVGQEQLLAVVKVVINSLRRYLKLLRLQLTVSSLLAFAFCLGQQFCARGPGSRGLAG